MVLCVFEELVFLFLDLRLQVNDALLQDIAGALVAGGLPFQVRDDENMRDLVDDFCRESRV
jgi:hypothetical protein